MLLDKLLDFWICGHKWFTLYSAREIVAQPRGVYYIRVGAVGSPRSSDIKRSPTSALRRTCHQIYPFPPFQTNMRHGSEVSHEKYAVCGTRINHQQTFFYRYEFTLLPVLVSTNTGNRSEPLLIRVQRDST